LERESHFSDQIARILEIAFAQFTIKQLIDKRDEVIVHAFLKAGLDSIETHKAMQAVRKARSKQYTPEGRLIEKKSNLSSEEIYATDILYRNHMLYQALGIYKDATTQQVHSAVQKQQALISTLEQQHKKEIQQI